MQRLLILLVLAFLAAPESAWAAEARDHAIEPEDYFSLTGLENLAIAPDGLTTAYTESRWHEDKAPRATDLWTVTVSEGSPRRMTFDGFGGAGCTWSPDGRWLYFLGRDKAGRAAPPHDGTSQIWRLPTGGGQPVAMTRNDGGVSSFELSPDGTTIFYVVDDEKVDDQWNALLKKYDDLEYGHGVTDLSVVRRLDLVSWRDEVAHTAGAVIWEMALSPDGKRLAIVTTSDNELIFKEGWSQVEVVDLGSGQVAVLTDQDWRNTHESPYGWIDDLAWSADSRALGFAIAYDGYASEIWVAENRDGTWPLQLVTRPDPFGYDGGLRWRGSGRTLCYRGEAMARVHILAVENVGGGRQGATRELTTGDVVVGAFDFDRRGGKLAAIIATPTDGNNIHIVESPDHTRRLTQVNPQMATWMLPQISHVSWPGADGEPCFGILELPFGYRQGDGPLPTVIELHGGPTSSTRISFSLSIYGRALFPARGYAVLSPNYHGSTGYGDLFLKKLIGRENDIEVKDIAAGARWLVDEGIADPERVGVMGWSNGGYLTNCMIVAEPDMFAAASSGAGVLDMVIQWGTEDTPGHVVNFMKGLPWQQPDAYRAASPLYGLDRVRTPTLIHVGGNDPRVPVAHSRALYRALQHYLEVPTQLVVYPGEPHGLTTRHNRLAKMQWDLAWFDKYLLGK